MPILRIFLLLLLLTACGQKGDLYLPTEQAAAEQAKQTEDEEQE